MDEIEKQKAEAAAKALAEAEAKRKADVEAAVKAEQARCLEIRNVVKEAGFDEGLADEYIKGNLTVEAARTNVELFKKYSIEKRNNTVASTTSVEVTTVNEEQRRQAIEEALLHRLDSQNFKLTERAREFAGGSVMRAMERHFPRKQFESDIEYAQRTMSSSDLPLILANVAEKSAQKRYELAPRTFAAWTSSGTLNNYKEATQVRGGDVGELKKRNEAGEYEESNIGEEGEKVQLEQYGVVHKFTDKMLVNDDLGMILEIANDSGTAVARLENKLAYEQLLTNPKMGDGENLFDKTKHGNVGTVGAIGETTFSEAFRDMRNQSTVDKRDKLNLSPMFLIVGPALETAAKKFLATITPTDSTDVNIFSNSVKIVVDPLITDDHYFFAADPSRINTVKIFRLAGKESAQVSSRVNWRNDAIELKIAHSVAAKAMDYRGLYRNKATSGQ